MRPCRALLQRFAWVLQQGWRQCVPNLARRLLGATAGDVDGHMRSAEGTAEVGDISIYFTEVVRLLKVRQIRWHRAGVDVIERDSPKNILAAIPKHDNGGVSCPADNFPVAAQQATRRQRNDTIAAVLSRENILQGLRCRKAEIVRRQVTVSKTLDRHSEEALDFDIQVEKPIFKEAGQSRAYGGLADTTDASKKYSHVANLVRAVPPRAWDPEVGIIRDSGPLLAGHSGNCGDHGPDRVPPD